MMLAFRLKTTLICLIAFCFVACDQAPTGAGTSSIDLNSTNEENTSLDETPNVPDVNPPANDTPDNDNNDFTGSDLNGFINQFGPFRNNTFLTYDSSSKRLALDFPFNLPLDLSIDINELAGLNIKTYEASGTRHLQASLPLVNLIGDNDWNLPLSGLPCGRSFPNSNHTELPHKKVSIGSQDIHFYAGPDILAMYIPTQMNIPASLTYSIINAKGDVLGYLSLLPTNESCKAGLYASIQLPQHIADDVRSNF